MFQAAEDSIGVHGVECSNMNKDASSTSSEFSSCSETSKKNYLQQSTANEQQQMCSDTTMTTTTTTEPVLLVDVWERYQQIQLIAEGTTCTVWMARKQQQQQQSSCVGEQQEQQQHVAVKVSTSPQHCAEFCNEVKLLRTVNHPNIVRMFDCSNQNNSDNQVSIVLEHLTGGDLLRQLPYTEDEAARVLYKLLSALQYLHHERGIVHRDIKPQNIMFDAATGEPKLIDLGLGRQLQDDLGETMSERVGSLLFMSPQVLQGSYTYKTDLWSVGALAYLMFSGRIPFGGDTEEEISQKILRGTPAPMKGPAWRRVSASAKALVLSLLTVDEDLRPTAAQAAAHEFFQQRGYCTTTTSSGSSSGLLQRNFACRCSAECACALPAPQQPPISI